MVGMVGMVGIVAIVLLVALLGFVFLTIERSGRPRLQRRGP
jgi:formate hydrogenlyase subunit 4